MTTAGKLTTIHNFCSQASCADGNYPEGELLLATNGSFYGTTNEGGAYGYGTVFKITTSGKLTTLHSFNQTDGHIRRPDSFRRPTETSPGSPYVGGATAKARV